MQIIIIETNELKQNHSHNRIPRVIATSSESTGSLNGRHEFVELRAWKQPEEFGLVAGRKSRHIGYEYCRHRSELQFRERKERPLRLPSGWRYAAAGFY
jgi:hypothetical protein